MWPALVGVVFAHEFSTLTFGPSPTWCADLHERAAPGDVVLLLAGAYPGGCDLSVGGLVELNEALLLAPFGNGPVVIEPDGDGLSLRVSGDTTRLLDLAFTGRLEVTAPNVSIDTCDVDTLDVDPGVGRITVLWSRLGAVAFSVGDTVVRGNVLDSLDVSAATGLVADNTILGDATTDVVFRRNLVVGDLTAVDVYASIVVGEADVAGRLFGSTLLGPVTAGDPRNSIATVAALPEAQGNLLCSDCLVDVSTLDVRPVGVALDAVPVEAPDDPLDFCSQPHDRVGAVGPIAELDGVPWSAYARDRSGCFEAVAVEPGTPPVRPPPPTPDPPDSLDPIEEPDAPIVRQGCSTAPGPIGGLLSLVMRWRS
ncbi:MAG: hypothetical protein H6737_04915 [Alphaproteobacteria bacterium]|nr:hypothetical protein [Alphaproteobacteria bacterium]